jgi:hypothetical protein
MISPNFQHEPKILCHSREEITMQKELQKGKAVAINITKIVNKPESFELMQKVEPKVCIATANHPGFLGFMALLQVG